MKYIGFNENEIQDFCKEVAKNVKDLRIKKGIKQIDLAVAININSTGSYSDYENNKQNKKFSLIHLYKISKVLDVNIKKLLP